MQADKQVIIWAILAATVFIALFGGATFLLAVSFARRKRRLLIDQERREATYRQELLQAQMEMQEHTFNIISQDIHDNVGQLLSLAKINLNIITLEQKESEAFLEVKELVTNAITELRHLGTGYYTERLADQGLVAAIRHLLNQVAKTGLVTTSFHCTKDSIRVERNHLIFLYRIIQEVLNNVIKHSGAEHVRVSVSHEGEEVTIAIKDNGKGFLAGDPLFKPGIGLSSIGQRAEMIGAKTSVVSIPGKGTLVNLYFKEKAL